jgi:hypothetical protein
VAKEELIAIAISGPDDIRAIREISGCFPKRVATDFADAAGNPA